MTAPILTAETLLEHEHFVRAVARGLLADAHAAEDVAQETWLRALRRDPRAPGALRGWLARVSGNLARDARRGTARRVLREERAARAEALESVDVAAVRLTLQRDVVAAILALAEPYRGVVLLRYYHELEPHEIAARLGAKRSTVRTQLVRAHELLRAQLDSRYGRESWAALLLPLAVPRPESATGGLKLVLGGLGAAAAAGVIWTVSRNDAERAAGPTLAAAPLVEPRVETAELAAPAPPEATRSPNAADGTGTVAPPPRTTETISPRAELLARSKYDDYERATFSFEFGLRDDPEGIVANDWDVEFTGSEFDARTVTNDVSLIIDLGEVPVTELGSWNGELPAASERTTAVAGHTYFLWTRDGNTDLASAFQVLELRSEDRCVLEWYATSDGESARASFHDASPGRGLAAKLLALREELFAQLRQLHRPGDLEVPRVLLQARNGAGGGNPYRIDVAGGLQYFRERAQAPLDPYAPVAANEESSAYCDGGTIPEGKVFVVTRATYWGIAGGDTDRSGFALVIGGQRIVENDRHENDLPEPLSGTWFGSIAVEPGKEEDTYLEVRDEGRGEAELFGELVDRFDRLPPPGPASARFPPLPRLGALREPHAKLQGRLAGGGKRFRVKLDGSLGNFRERAEAPLDVMAPFEPRESPRADCDGGVVPAGKVFVVTRVDYRGFAGREGARDGGFALVLAGERVLEYVEGESISGTWLGSIAIPGGNETRTYLEVNESSAGEVELSGVFVEPSDPLATAPPSIPPTSPKSGPRQRPRQPRPGELRLPFAMFQGRNGAGGGSPFRVMLDGSLTSFEGLAADPLDLEAPIDEHERARAYWRGGLVPLGKVFVVTRVNYWAVARGDGNGPGGFAVVIAGERIVEYEETEPTFATWVGRIEVPIGAETLTYLEIRNSSAGKASLHGEFVDAR